MTRVRYFLNYFIVIVLSSFFIATNSLSLDNNSSNEILAKIDSYRVPLTEGQIYARLIEFKNDEIDKTIKIEDKDIILLEQMIDKLSLSISFYYRLMSKQQDLHNDINVKPRWNIEDLEALKD